MTENQNLGFKSFVFGCIAAILLILQLSAQAAEPTHLSVATFNTWGVPVAVWDTWRYGEAMKALEKMSSGLYSFRGSFLKQRSKELSQH